jgi:hypothetical protein
MPDESPAACDPSVCLGAEGSGDPDLGGAFARIQTDVRTEGKGEEAHKGRVPTEVRKGKNLGKKNATNAFTQAIREAYSFHRKQMTRIASAPDSGAGSGGAGGPAPAASTRRKKEGIHPGEPNPMLVKKVGDTKKVRLEEGLFAREPGVFGQPKLDGVRVVSYLRAPGGHPTNGPASDHTDALETGVAMYSRTSKPYAGISHVRRALSGALNRAAEAGLDPRGLRVDGEIYKHGKPLRWISGQARKADDESTLEYWIYDVFRVGADGSVLPDTGLERQALLDRLAPLFPAAGVLVRVPNYPLRTVEETNDLSRKFLAAGYEGLIVRRPGAPYVPGTNNYHSDSLFKIKPLHDAEFTIVGFGTGDRGKAKDALMWLAQVPEADSVDPDDRTFRVTPKDISDERRRWMAKCLAQPVGDGVTRFQRDFYGKPLTVEFPSRSSKTGKPEQAKALAVRTYEGDHAEDPVVRMERECGPGPA